MLSAESGVLLNGDMRLNIDPFGSNRRNKDHAPTKIEGDSMEIA